MPAPRHRHLRRQGPALRGKAERLARAAQSSITAVHFSNCSWKQEKELAEGEEPSKAHGKEAVWVPEGCPALEQPQRWIYTTSSAGKTLPDAAGEGKACRHLAQPASSPHGRRACAGGRQQAAGSCPGTSGQPGAFGAGRWSQAAPRSLAFAGSIPGRVLGGQPAAGPLPQHPAEHPLPLPRGHGDGAGTEESVLETRGAGGCWHWLCSHLPQRLGAAPPRLVPLFKDLLGATYSRQREKMCSEAKCPLEVLGRGRGTPEARSPPQPPHLGRC